MKVDLQRFSSLCIEFDSPKLKYKAEALIRVLQRYSKEFGIFITEIEKAKEYYITSIGHNRFLEVLKGYIDKKYSRDIVRADNTITYFGSYVEAMRAAEDILYEFDELILAGFFCPAQNLYFIHDIKNEDKYIKILNSFNYEIVSD